MLKEVKVQTRLSARSRSDNIIWMKSNNIDLTRENFRVRKVSKRRLADVHRTGLVLVRIIRRAFGVSGVPSDDLDTLHFHHAGCSIPQTRALRSGRKPRALQRASGPSHSARGFVGKWLGAHFECKWILHAFLSPNVIFLACQVYSSYI